MRVTLSLMTFVLVGLPCFSQAASKKENRTPASVSTEIKKRACAKLMGIVPTEKGKGISMKECLAGQFDVVKEDSVKIHINWIGQTVEDMATTCNVNLLKNIGHELKLPDPSCDLQ